LVHPGSPPVAQAEVVDAFPGAESSAAGGATVFLAADPDGDAISEAN
jgi:hypothetical protein